MIKSIIFDFDGVIVYSNHVKADAFVELFSNYPYDIRESIKKFYLENGGMSRFDKFKYIYANILKEPLLEEKFNGLCIGFNRLVVDGVINVPFVEGVIDFLESNRDKYDMYIVSGTPEDEIKYIAKRRGIDKYFLGIYGSPRLKKELICNIIEDHNYKNGQVVFLGDSINDYEGARAAGVEFVAKISDDLGIELFGKLSLKTKIKTMLDFQKYLDGENG